jgi:hypothetical protein
VPTVDLTAATETDAAQAYTLVKTKTLDNVHETDVALVRYYDAGPARLLTYFKQPELGVYNEINEALPVIVTHVIQRTITPVTEADSAQAVTTTVGDIQFVSITPVSGFG